MQYTHFAELYTKDRALLSLLERLSTEGGMAKNIGKSPLTCSVLYSFEPDDMDLMVGAAYYFIITRTNSTLFNAASFYFAAKSTLAEVDKVYTELAAKVQPYFLYFMSATV